MSVLPIPPIESATDPIESPADLGQRWRALMGELGFGERLLRITFVGPDRRLLKVLTDVEVGPAPYPPMLDELMWSLREVLCGMETGCTVAALLSRPGRGGISDSDRSWSRALTAAAARCGLPIEPFFRANDEAVVPVPPGVRAQESPSGEVPVGR